MPKRTIIWSLTAVAVAAATVILWKLQHANAEGVRLKSKYPNICYRGSNLHFV